MSNNNYSDFGHSFQTKALALVLQDPVFYQQYSDIVQPQYFEDPNLAAICRCVRDFHKKYGQVPGEPELGVVLTEEMQGTNMTLEERQSLFNLISHLFVTDVGTKAFVVDKIRDFGSLQALKGAVFEVVENIKGGTPDPVHIRSLVERALAVGSERDLGMNFGASYASLGDVIKRDKIYDYSRKICTGWSVIDGAIRGVSPGEFAIIVGSKNVGKSTLLANLGFSALLQRRNVLHITLELKETDVAIKYAARISGLTMNEIVMGPPERYTVPIELLGLSRNSLIIKYFSPATLTPTMLRQYLSRLRSEGIAPDLVVIDYLKQMRCVRDHNGYGELVDALMGVMDDYDIAIWTAHQGNRSTRDSDNVGVGSIGDSWQIIEKCDVALTVSQTADQKTHKKLWLNLECARRGKDGIKEIPMIIDYERALVEDDPDAPPKAPKNTTISVVDDYIDKLKVQNVH